MNQHLLYSLAAVLVLGLIGYAGGSGMPYLFGVIIPYAAMVLFFAGFAMRMLGWVKSPVPFRIPTTCGQQQSFSWIQHSKYDNPSNKRDVLVRMLLEIFLFRSLFRNTKNEIREGKVVYNLEIWLWLFGLIFHYSFLVVLVRHLRFFLEPIPALLKVVEMLDGILQIGLPGILLSGFLLLGAALFLFARRILIPQVRYISLTADYFPVLLIASIAGTGILMRYVAKVDIFTVKQMTMSLATFSPVVPEGIGGLFYAHFFLVCVLFAYFPFSKLMHSGGIFLSPTRNMANNSRAVRHINPWNPKLKFVTYADYEDEFREKMIEAGLPVEKKE
ncbi:putative sulfite reductase-associated electron transfer protein DsrM [Desulfobotulus alkaliphilus]|uniref:Putative sulfite reductase-associated electron transfer protein DsrM n=1 Tax=Desulfobotulus alkaliphilus TaxID=622671 RepID=A0A562R530_9BACT|nr:sulfate reduction electron transfer complex DsrMKJOP subunit DsrM [Desulfobotulus alkaliphilus]TWI63953.1 putative sulfite reductase-associated electron transfer protein DsrM [Desulfobotulus alkaliphilus]